MDPSFSSVKVPYYRDYVQVTVVLGRHCGVLGVNGLGSKEKADSRRVAIGLIRGS